MAVLWYKAGVQNREGLRRGWPRPRARVVGSGVWALLAGLKDDREGSSRGISCVSNRFPVSTSYTPRPDLSCPPAYTH